MVIVTHNMQQAARCSDHTAFMYLGELIEFSNTDDLFTANRDGMALFDGGRKLDISGRHYFRLAIDGIPNISDKLISRINGDEVFVISCAALV